MQAALHLTIAMGMVIVWNQHHLVNAMMDMGQRVILLITDPQVVTQESARVAKHGQTCQRPQIQLTLWRNAAIVGFAIGEVGSALASMDLQEMLASGWNAPMIVPATAGV